MNITAYLIYLIATFYITIYVGKVCYTYGEVFILGLFDNNINTTKSINNILLVGYYLINLGYATLNLINWQPINSIADMVAILSFKIGIITLGLGIMHYFNIYILNLIHNKKYFLNN